MMNELIAAVTALVGEETQRAKENHGEKYASLHEGYGVLAEEVQEIEDKMEDLSDDLNKLLRFIRGNHIGEVEAVLSYVYDDAINAACECIQVAAVARKMREGL